MVVFIMLVASLGYLVISPKIQQWKFSRKIVDYSVSNFSYSFLFLMIGAGLLCFVFSETWIGYLLGINFFISSVFLYKLKSNYKDKSYDQRTIDFRYFTITLPSILALAFLSSGGLQKLLR